MLTPLVDELFPEEVLERWRRAQGRTEHLEFRLAMLDRSFPVPEGWPSGEFERR